MSKKKRHFEMIKKYHEQNEKYSKLLKEIELSKADNSTKAKPLSKEPEKKNNKKVELKYRSNIPKEYKESSGEMIIKQELLDKKIYFLKEVEFNLCVNPRTKKKLRFDFYLPALNILIEYDGVGFHDDTDTKYRDRVKTAFAKANEITLYRITGIRNIKHLLEERIGLKLSDVRPSKLYSEFNKLRDLENKKKWYKGGKLKKSHNFGNKCKRKKKSK